MTSIETNNQLIARYKTDINLVAYLETKGFELDKKDSTRNWPVMRDASGRKLLISRNSTNSQYYYTNVHDGSDKGNIISLVAKDYKLDLSGPEGWKELHKVCSEMIGNHYYTETNNRNVKQFTHTPEEGIIREYRIDPLKNTQFLEQDRRLSLDTIFAPEFDKKIFNRPFVDQTFETAGKNTVFPLENLKGITGLIVRNPTWNQIVGQKADGIWVSNLLPDQPVRSAFIAESPIDCLSYHQLNPPQNPGERLYLSTAGTIGQQQPLTIQHILNTTRPDQLILGGDNDLPGIRYNITLLGKLLMPNQADNGVRVQISNIQAMNTLTIEVIHKPDSQPKTKTEELLSAIQQTMNRGFPDDAPKATVELVTNRNDTKQIKVSFPNIRPLLIRAEQLTLTIRGLQQAIKVHRAIENDWNDTLRMQAVRQQVQKELNISLNQNQLNEVIKTGKSPILLSPTHDAGKVILDYTNQGVKTSFVPRAETLTIPSEYMGIPFTEPQRKELEQTGRLRERQTLTNPTTQETYTGYIGIDAELKKLLHVRTERIQTQVLNNLDLSKDQIRALMKGEVLKTTEKVKNKETRPVIVAIHGGAGKIVIKADKRTLKQTQSINEQKTEPSAKSLQKAKKNIVKQPDQKNSQPVQNEDRTPLKNRKTQRVS